ncbi:hypothetical protein GOHSU_45_00440 [Gordonia hirsuta DSM 44140 = NBRC 16056]|uniref:YlxR domain-containing protein n=1 Tax=Gordonia hirsuta DSM 44140 = NBRC 16056 TaxID=1121927 RepID=L7LF45_9ACTN|nr:hypothetical protein GOHSU_45_00440 [Gordonia hirsuta DSM 44140 = NBRC 16056]
MVADSLEGGSREGATTLVIDHRKSLPGRGAWLHPSQSCVAAAVRRQSFGPALRVRGLTVDPNDLAEIFGEGGQEGSAASQTGE